MSAPDPMTVLLLVLATWRATRLIVEDGILDGPRDRLLGWASRTDRTFLSELIICPHCVSVWVAAGLIAVTAQILSVPEPLLVFAAAAAGASLIADFRPEHG